MVAWAVLFVWLSAFHTSDAWTFRIGMVLGELGVYGLCSIFIHDPEDVRRIFKVLASRWYHSRSRCCSRNTRVTTTSR